MKRILLIAAVFSCFFSNAQVVINELDADQVATDAGEFVELIGEPNISLDGLVVVFFNGSNDQSYAAFDLDGYFTDANGLFVLGNPGIASAQINFPDNTLQNGQDAVAVYTGSAADWPNNTPVTSANLVDAVVYDTNDADDTGLLDALTPGQPQIDENADSNGTDVSISRVPDGGDPFNTSVFVLQAPTPGAFNTPVAPDCEAGFVAAVGFKGPVILCSDAEAELISFEMINGTPGDNTWFILTNTSGDIADYATDGTFDLLTYPLGNYNVYAFTFTGMANLGTLADGLPISGVESDDCYDVSTGFASVQIIDCSVPVCGGGTVVSSSSAHTSCSNAESYVVDFTVTGQEENANYLFLLTNAADAIVETLGGNTLETADLAEGTYHIWGLSYYDVLDETTLEAGDPVSGIQTSGTCAELSANYITINIVNCDFENGCQTLIISQYYEGTGFNKAIELYNTSNFPVDLDEYEVFLYSNGSMEYTSAFAPQGILPGGETFLIVHPQAETALTDIADTLFNVVNFNGDDVIILQHNLVNIDVFGQLGEDPGTSWIIPGGTTENNSLIRYNYITEPNIDWSITQTQYFSSLPLTDFSTLGSHDFIACSDIPQMGFTISAMSVAEDIGTVGLVVQAYNIPQALDIQVTLNDGTATAGEDYVNEGPYTLSFEAGNSSQTLTVTIINDEIEEDEAEYFDAVLSSATEVDFIIPSLTVTIESSDQSYPLYDIAEVRVENESGIMDSIGVFCELRGIVHGINFNSDGTHFHILDETGGIKVFSANSDLGYTVTEGDSVHVRGYIEQFMGQAEIRPDFIELIDGGHDLQTPTVITSLSEINESSLVTMSCIHMTNPGQWIPSGTGFTVDVTDGTNNAVLWIDGDSEIFSGGPLYGTFIITGIVEQMDAMAPFDNNYVILPRYNPDITDQIIASFSIPDPIVFGDNGVTIEIVNSSTGAATFEWDFGDGNTGEGDITEYTYTYESLAPNADITVMLIAGSANCSDVASVTVDLVYSSVEEHLAEQLLNVYPNPAESFLRVDSKEMISRMDMVDMTGRRVYTQQNINATSVQADIQALAPAVYMLRVFTGNGIATMPVVIR